MKVSDSPIVFISTKEESLWTFDKAGVLKLWELEKSKYKISKEIVTGHLGFARPQFLNSSEKNLLIAPSSDSDFSVIDLNSGSETQTVKAPDDGIKQVMCLKPLKMRNEYKVLAGYGNLINLSQLFYYNACICRQRTFSLVRPKAIKGSTIAQV